MMTVAQLREALADLPDDMPVVMSKDAEGNGFSPLDGTGRSHYYPESTWSGDCIGIDDHEGLEEYGPGQLVIVLWPTN